MIKMEIKADDSVINTGQFPSAEEAKKWFNDPANKEWFDSYNKTISYKLFDSEGNEIIEAQEVPKKKKK